MLTKLFISSLFTDGSSKPGDGGDDGASSVGGMDDILRPPQPVYQGPNFAKLQQPFIPGSTPAHLSSRFMVREGS